MPLVSVIVPNYNHAKHLDKRFTSIFNQTFQDFEVIVLDDRSTDESRDVIEKYRSHPKMSTIIYNEQNSGSTFLQWQKGISLSRGSFVWIAESDDFSERTFLEELVVKMEADPSITLAFCQTIYVSTDNRITARTETAWMSQTLDGREFASRYLLGTNAIVNASMALFRRETLSTVSDDFTRMRYCGDWLFWVDLSLKGKVLISGKYLNYYLRHAGNVASKATREGYDFIEGNKIFKYVAEHVNPSPADRQKGLNERITEYLRTKPTFLDAGITAKVEELMDELDPQIRTLIRKRVIKEKIFRILQFAKKLVPGL